MKLTKLSGIYFLPWNTFSDNNTQNTCDRKIFGDTKKSMKSEFIFLF